MPGRTRSAIPAIPSRSASPPGACSIRANLVARADLLGRGPFGARAVRSVRAVRAVMVGVHR